MSTPADNVTATMEAPPEINATETASMGSSLNGSNDTALWGGLAALLAALGLGGIALARRNNRKSANTVQPAPHNIPPHVAALTASDRRLEPANPEPQPIVHEALTPARNSQHAHTMSYTIKPTRYAEPSRLEAMIAEAPSDANPFLTRRNRKRRAAFILKQVSGQAPIGKSIGYQPANIRQPETAQSANAKHFGEQFGITRKQELEPA